MYSPFINRILILVILLILSAGLPELASAQSSHEIYQRGLQKEIGEGNLNEAIQLYRQVNEDQSADRRVRANAQLHIGICYEKLGIEKAKRAYQNVLENFADQHDVVAEARNRLARFEHKFSHVNPDAREAFIKAKHYLGMGNIHKALDYYKQAIALDSTFAQAYTELAWLFAYSGKMGTPKERMPVAEGYALKALEIDSNLGKAHTALGMVRMYYYWDWAGAEREYLRALELNPNDTQTMRFYAIFLSSQGRLDEALIVLERALRFDPVDLWVNEYLADHYMYQREFDRAIKQYYKTLELHPQSRVTHLKLSNPYHKKNMVDEQIRSVKNYFLAMGDTIMADIFVNTYLESGYKQAMLKWIEAWQHYTTGQGVQATSIAFSYMSIDEYDKAIEWLQKGYELKNKEMIMLGVRPMFDDLRSDKRFLELLDKIGLPH